MRILNKIATVLLAGTMLSCSESKIAQVDQDTVDYTKFVDPYIGTGGHGHVFLGANVPFGMVQLGPVNLSKGWDWCSGYHDSDSTIIGFSHTRLSGTGIGDLGDILFMPNTGKMTFNKGSFDDLSRGWVSTFQKENEVVEPGYYKVKLDKTGIVAEMTASTRVGYQKYKFPAGSKNNHVILDLGEGVGKDEPIETVITVVDKKTITGYRTSKGWAEDQKIYFVAKFSAPFTGSTLVQDTKEQSTKSVKGINTQAGFAFDVNDLEVKVALSYVSINNAKENLRAENAEWDFAKSRENAKNVWLEELAKADAEFNTEDQKTIFYTGLYHSVFAPQTFSDVNGDYMGADKKVHNDKGRDNYTVFSLWDTYRATHPWYTLTQKPERVNDMVNSMLNIYDQQGKLPVWHLVGNETNTMVGYHAVPVIVDAYLKGYSEYDVDKAYEAMKSFSKRDERGLKYVNEIGYIPAEKEGWSVAKALEYAIDDHSIAQMANVMGKQEDFKEYTKRGKYYQNYFDPETGFMRGKLSNGKWRTPFNPSHSVHMHDDYVEGNAWQYTWLVPHDPQGLVETFGGIEKFRKQFDKLFTVSSELNEGASIDITGMIGQYAHGNEPSHHILYLYNLTGEHWKGESLIRRVYDEFYHVDPDGLIGNEDCGQMSSWYLFSSLGFYPVDPVGGAYVFGSPIVKEATIKLNNGKALKVVAHNNANDNVHIQSIKWNGKPFTSSSISHETLMEGGVLEYEMGAKPNKNLFKTVQ